MAVVPVAEVVVAVVAVAEMVVAVVAVTEVVMAVVAVAVDLQNMAARNLWVNYGQEYM